MAQDLKNIKAIALDIDGVLTDGSLIPMADGDVLRIMNARDAFAIRFAANQGLITSIMSGGKTEALYKRCLSMHIKPENLFLGCRGKLDIFRKFCEDHQLDPSEVAYFGDDVADTQVLKACGAAFVPSDACPEALAVADFVMKNPGGRCAAREGIEMILKAQGKWEFDENGYEKLY